MSLFRKVKNLGKRRILEAQEVGEGGRAGPWGRAGGRDLPWTGGRTSLPVGSKGGSVRLQLLGGFGSKRWRELLVGGFSLLCKVGDSCVLRAEG